MDPSGPRALAQNVKALGVNFRNLDFVVISHRHADHTSGINYLLKVNPKVKICVPDEPWGLFARGVKNDFYRRDPALPADMRYYRGNPPEIVPWLGDCALKTASRPKAASALSFVAASMALEPV